MADEMNTNAAAANAPMLRIADLHVYYGAIHALKGLSLEVKEGEIVTLIGANGAGKSTTLRTISGLIAPKSGTVAFEGRNIAGTGAHEIVRLGLSQVPEGRRIFAEMTVLENLELGAFIRSDKDGIADDMEMVFERFPRLKERRTQQAGTLSGNPIAMAAGIATLGLISKPGFHDELTRKMNRLVDGLNAAAKKTGAAFSARALGGLGGMYFRATPPTYFEEATDQNLEQYKRFYHLMLDGGVYLPPSPVEAFFLSSAHTDADIDQTVALAEKSLAAAMG